MLILASMIACCLVLDKGSDLGPLLCLAEEVFLLGLHSQLLMTRLLPQTINLYASISINLSSDYLMSSNTSHGPLPIYGPFIPTIAPRNFTLLLLGKKRGFQSSNNYPSHFYVIFFCAGVFSTTKKHAPDASASRTLQHLFYMALCPPRSMVWWKSCGGEILWGFGQELSHLLCSPLYILLEDSGCSTFCIFNSQELVRRALLHLRKLPLAFFLKFKTFSSSANLISPRLLNIFNYLSNG